MNHDDNSGAVYITRSWFCDAVLDQGGPTPASQAELEDELGPSSCTARSEK